MDPLQFQVFSVLTSAYQQCNYKTQGYKSYHKYCGKKVQRLGRLLGLTHIQSGKSYNPSNWQNLSVLESLCTTGSKKLAKYLEYIVFLGESLWANSQIRTSPLNKHSRKRAITRSLSAANILLKAVRTLLDEQHLAKESVFEVETYVDFLKCERETLFEAPQDQALVDHLYATLKSLKLVRSRYSANDISRQTVAFMDLKISEILNLLKSAPKSLTLDVDLAMSLEQLKGKDSCESDVELLLVDKLSPSINKLWADFRVFHQEPAKPVSIPSKKRNELLWKSKGHVNQIIKILKTLKNSPAIASNVFLVNAMDSRIQLFNLILEQVHVLKMEPKGNYKNLISMNLRIQEQLSELNDSFVDQQESLQKVHWTLDEKASLTTFTGVLAITLARLQRSEALRQEQEVTAKASEKETRLLVSSEVKPIFYDLALDCIQYPEVPPTFAPTATDMRPSAGLGNILKKWWTS